MNSISYRLRVLAIAFALLGGFHVGVRAAAPNLTAAGVIATLKTDPNSSPLYGETYNLGPTGLRGWIYIGGGNGADGTITTASRQILVTVASTPGSAVLAVDDVILGAMAGSSGTVPVFTSDCRKAFGVAIGDAEKTGAGTLRVKRWRAGVTNDVNIPMTIMGDYTATAPYSCPKSSLILSNARTSLVSQLLASPAPSILTSDWAGAINGLALLAGVAPGDPNYATVQTRLQTYARSLAAADPNPSGLYVWDWGYIGVFLGEYYLSTGDTNVVTGVNSYTVALARVQSRYGTYSHIGSLLKADGSLHGTIPPYGPVNQAGIPANIAIVIGKKALVAAGQAIDPEINPAIQRGSDFFAYYVNKGPIPYGEHAPFMDGHSSNGKDALCAVLFGLQAGRTVETEYFSRMSVASFSGREYGHTGQGFSYLWGAMGANMGGSLAVAEHLKQVRWHLDLERRTDGSFIYDGAEQYGAGSTADGTYLGDSSYAGMNSTAPYLLTFALPLQRLYITGKNAIPTNTLAAAKVTNAIAAATYNLDCTNQTAYPVSRLITALSEFDPVVRNYAAIELARRSLTTNEVNTLITMLTVTNANSRMAACQTLGILKNTTALPLIAQRLSDADLWVRAQAATALRNYNSSDASTQLTPMLTAFAANATDPEIIVWNDPVQIANGYLSLALFGDAILGGNNIANYTINASQSLLYPAVKTGLKQPDSYPRTGVAAFSYNYLSLSDVQALIPDFIEVSEFMCQADTMWSQSPRAWGIQTLAKYHIAEAIPLALELQELPQGPAGWFSDEYQIAAFDTLASYGDAARWTLPTLRIALGTRDTASSPYINLVNAINTIETSITAPTLVPGFAVANSQVAATTGSKAITLTGTSPRTSVTFTNVTAPAHGTLTGPAPNLIYTPTGGYTGPDSFTFQVTDVLTTSVPGTISIIVGTAGAGLKGEYFDNTNFTNLKLTRTDAQVNFDWGTGSPDASVGADTFSVRWSGLLLIPETGTYKFSTLNSDGARLYINGVPVTDDYVDQTTNWKDGVSINLTAGQMVELQMEYYENTGSAVAKLKWTGPSFAGVNGAIIAKEWLFDGTGVTNRTPYAHAQNVTSVQNTAQAITLSGSGSTLTYSVVTPPAHGTLTGTAPNLTYTPATNYNGTDSFTFLVNNGSSNSTPATVSIGILAGQPLDFFWTTAVSGYWSTASRWTGSVAPATAGQPYYSLNFTAAGTYTATHNLTTGFKLNQLNMSGEVTIAGTKSLAFNANGYILPQFNQNSGSAVIITTPLSLAATTRFGGIGGGSVTITNLISGAGGLTKDSPGTLQISKATNTYSGGTIISNGTLRMSDQAHAALGTGSVTLNGGTLSLNRINITNALTVNGGRILADGGWGSNWDAPVTLNVNLTIGVPSYDRIAFNGAISGVGGMTLNDAGLVMLEVANSYTGPTRVTTGTLQCNVSNALGTGALSISSGAKVDLNYTGTRTIASLTTGGMNQLGGTYGSTDSPAANKNDTYFSGTGTVTVLPFVTLTNAPATHLTSSAATLNSTLACAGTNAAVHVHWNTVNGGNSATLWSNSTYLGSWTNVTATNLSLPLSGLSPQTQYYFTFRSTNQAGNVWATNVQSFTTLATLTPPEFSGGGMTVPGGVPTFTFATVPGYQYRLVFKDALRNASWLPVIAPPNFPAPDGWSIVSTGGSMSLSGTTTAGLPQRFYRIEAGNP